MNSVIIREEYEAHLLKSFKSSTAEHVDMKNTLPNTFTLRLLRVGETRQVKFRSRSTEDGLDQG